MASVVDTELRLGRDLLGELLAGTTEPAIRGRLAAVGCDPDELHIVALIEGRSRSGDAEVFRQAVRTAAHDHGIGGLLTAREDDIVLICPRNRAWREFHAGIMLLLPAGKCRVGVGGPCRGIPELSRSHHEAQLALSIQRVAGGHEQVTEFESLGVYRLLGGLDTSTVESIVDQWLGSLLRYDEKRHTQLTRTLSVYLASGRHYESTARSLSVHPSTLKYRLQRIRELTGHDLNDPDTQFNLQVATRAWNTMQAMRAVELPAGDL
jgi:sugar diacid utilization regulator